MPPGVRTIESAGLLVDARAGLGEGPVWDPQSNRLIWLDLVDWWNRADDPTSVVHVHDPDGGAGQAIEVAGGIGSVALRSAGGLVVAGGDGFGTLDLGSGTFRPVAPLGLEKAGHRFNDGGCDPQGRFWAGTAQRSSGRPGECALYRLDTDWQVEKTLSGVTVSNGIGWSPDGEVMYYIDTPTGRIDRFRFDGESGSLGPREVLAEVPDRLGVPDGLAVDAQGCVWVAVWGSSRVLRFTPRGRLDSEVVLPVSIPTSCAFGGPDLATLYITSAWATLTDEQLSREPHAGGVFATDVGVEGRPEPIYAG